MNERYEVGYRKPPQANRFQKGRSGNPMGRPKKDSNIGSFLKDMMDEDVPIQGKTTTVSKKQAIVRALIDNAMNGNQRAFRRFLALAKRAGLFAKPREKKVGNLGTITFPFNPTVIQAKLDRIRARKRALLVQYKRAEKR